MLIGFDVYHKAQRLMILPNGLKYKRQFQPYTTVQKIYTLTYTSDVFKKIIPKLRQFCAESHADFSHPKPLWKNEAFFIILPFKKNEDINPTKATHPGMTPDDEQLAQQECTQLRLGLIERTTSNWACQAFYVNKRAEIRRGKKRLVIDYKPLNHFLAGDKFLLPRPQNMFARLPDAQWFSKFNLKAGFWQLGIQPEVRYKIAFCIPNAQFQWTVMPFGLKVASSLFQKAMTRIFEPLFPNVLIYIDDIILFSKDVSSHLQLLRQFFPIVNQHGIMLSEKRVLSGKTKLNFLV